MRALPLLITALLFASIAMTQPARTPDEIYGVLFRDVQENHVFPDSKTFVDCIPKRPPAQIMQDYLAFRNNPLVRYSLERFVADNFVVPVVSASHYVSTQNDVVDHITELWRVLSRARDTIIQGSSLLPLPHDYVVPGGRFREIYYWDSYFTMLGLRESGDTALIANMVRNFAYLIQQYGHIPNGNRTYYLSRSQPPFFSLMVELLAGLEGDRIYTENLAALEREYAYWMDKSAETRHVVHMPDGSILNRYWDAFSIPRQEAYTEDMATAPADPQEAVAVFKHIRSAAESGWDFSSRWFRDGRTLATIHTTDLVPVDLNCLLHHLEMTIAHAYALTHDQASAARYTARAGHRRKAILAYCWDARAGWFCDYDSKVNKRSPELTLAGMTPFFLNVATKQQAAAAVPLLRKSFLKPGGVVTTLKSTGQQWDAPNGWAPLQWMTVAGLENYGEMKLAKTIADRWIALNIKVYTATGKLTEKYDVVHADKPGGGGEYPSQDGFGWTNGVLLALIHRYGINH
ncbi:MAG: trehalase [Flaviaesturariibacter sp.]|nr:trehalase [Flaviaesturariibacter sp.]